MERSKAFAERLNVVVRTLDERLAGHVVSHRFLWGAVEAAGVWSVRGPYNGKEDNRERNGNGRWTMKEMWTEERVD